MCRLRANQSLRLMKKVDSTSLNGHVDPRRAIIAITWSFVLTFIFSVGPPCLSCSFPRQLLPPYKANCFICGATKHSLIWLCPFEESWSLISEYSQPLDTAVCVIEIHHLKSNNGFPWVSAQPLLEPLLEWSWHGMSSTNEAFGCNSWL